MAQETCIKCNRKTVSVISTDDGFLCYNCYAENKNPVKAKRVCRHDEDDIQEEFFRIVHAKFPQIPDKLLFSVPNGGKRDKFTGAIMKRTGSKKGVADVILLLSNKRYNCLCLEFKTDIGRQSTEQKEFQKQIESSGGKYEIVRSAINAIEIITDYLDKR